MRTGRAQMRHRNSIIKGVRRTGFIRQIILFMLMLVIFMYSTSNGSGIVSAHDNKPGDSANHKYYKSIEVRAGDTLWAIAEEYMDEDHQAVSEYVNELIEINQLDSGRIHEGRYLTIIYYL